MASLSAARWATVPSESPIRRRSAVPPRWWGSASRWRSFASTSRTSISSRRSCGVVNAALERRPNAGFDLVAVTPAVGDPAKVALETNRARRNAELVLRSLVNMGLPPERTSLAATSSPDAQVNEVHLYVR